MIAFIFKILSNFRTKVPLLPLCAMRFFRDSNQGYLYLCRIPLAFSCKPSIMSATSWKNRKNAEPIQSDLQGLANNGPVKSQSMKIL